MAPQHRATICVFLYLFFGIKLSNFGAIRKLTYNHVWSKKTFCTNKRCNKATCVKNPGFKTSCPNPYPSPRAIIATTYICTSLGLRQPLASSAAPSKRRAWQAYQKNIITIKKNPTKLIVPLTIFWSSSGFHGFASIFHGVHQFVHVFSSVFYPVHRFFHGCASIFRGLPRFCHVFLQFSMASSIFHCLVQFPCFQWFIHSAVA